METTTIQLKIRRATKTDVMNDAGTDLKAGVVFFCESAHELGRITGPYKISADRDVTNRQEFARWYRERRVWVPVCALDNEISITTKNS